ncbi:phospholipase D delta-like isoform X1 [Oryza glaberrima]|uniref:Phospholipase D n=1 Tax=Oryza glaberrima TaxID=4538 RepID=I1Q9L2_ORYGL|nr:phospholipase D delta-like isoform X1 [Oryza glaberrima]XP_052163483.1 phospholipase D delta-like isoform X1 [Oryza glaberrima]XP_052163485.1 phospholipase D delta-like isoform X1 [Oryza glaberrima]
MGKHSAESGTSMLLHGDLDIQIVEAKCLPNMDLMTERMRKCFTGYGACSTECGKSDPHTDVRKIITSDPYVSVCLSGATVAQTRVIANSENPKWDEHFYVQVAHSVSRVEFHVKDNDVFGAELIGVASVPVENITPGDTVSGWFPISGQYSNPMKASPELHLSIQYKPIEQNPLYKDGVGSDGCQSIGVPNAYFPLRKGGMVTLYQDAHIPDDFCPKIEIDGGRVYEQNKCWEDICHAIAEAHHLIYIIGWSLYHPVKLVRESTKPVPNGSPPTLGGLLKSKVQEGVRVIVLLWDDKTSHDKFLLKTDGLMHTHDEEARKFFRHSGVHCVLAPRYASNKLSIFKQQVVGTLFTHHQKCVIVDTQVIGNNRKITAFIGGLDLCDGRYDTPEHRLFKDLDTVFKDDFHNPTFQVNKSGPRQPWHDLHCKIEGPAAYDILTNFEQRWRKSAKWKVSVRRAVSWHHDTLVKINRMSWIVSPSADELNARVCEQDDPENWHVQIFRSIDSGSVKGFPKLVQEAESQNLVCAKNLQIDKSIHNAYVKAIRSAQHYIYIENQYFIGSSYYWSSNRSAGAENLIPIELAIKIARKIKARERFAAYIVIPMWPEGNPTTAAMQEILFWQGQTMSMMYKIVAEALQKEGLHDTHPQDYLNFYCLGKREVSNDVSTTSQSNENSPQRLVQKFKRFMIYVHSKGMIVDDEYVLIGSANINQRSMDGSRDTEIAMGAYQPHYSWAGRKKAPRGQVYGYRMSLWAEHLGTVEECFRWPHSVECVRQVNEMAEENWARYVSPEMVNMRGHLMRYPINVERDGRVGPVHGYECFPDVGGKVLGTHSSLPNALTT